MTDTTKSRLKELRWKTSPPCLSLGCSPYTEQLIRWFESHRIKSCWSCVELSCDLGGLVYGGHKTLYRLFQRSLFLVLEELLGFTLCFIRSQLFIVVLCTLCCSMMWKLSTIEDKLVEVWWKPSIHSIPFLFIVPPCNIIQMCFF